MGFYGNKILESQEVLNEKTLFSSPKIMIAVNPDQTKSVSFANDPYFKIYDADSFNSAKRIARISLKDPHYIYHKNNRGKEQWILNASERKTLITALTTIIGNKTVYDLLLDDIFNYCGIRPNIPLPDFSIIKR